MKILILGADGFIGTAVNDALAVEHDVIGSSKEPSSPYYADLADKASVHSLLKKVSPDAIINCAGVVDKNGDTNLNAVFTGNLIEAANELELQLRRIIVLGSASEYGNVDPKNLPVDESAPLNANTGYGLSKLKETRLALELGKKYGLPVLVARIFNPVGRGMHPKFIIPSLLRQTQAIQSGERRIIEVNRLDSKRDYVHIKDVAAAIKTLIENNPKERVYNIGSGQSTTNGELVELIVQNSKLEDRPGVSEISAAAEPLVASQADISRIKNELGWTPRHSLEEAIKDITHAAGH